MNVYKCTDSMPEGASYGFAPLSLLGHENKNNSNSVYRKNSKNWETLCCYRDCPTNGIVGFYSAILRSKDADRITNRVDTD